MTENAFTHVQHLCVQYWDEILKLSGALLHYV